ncbi:aldo/keto reductase [Lichenihabitans sp. Uapishka_5]|uniref:aldo/keto reductase n=1 Tax=Lichenihabitans sp. Uapishka_5 TaxID=3037302 RepID=UPI0029E80665|nr:aldo/keto reductase [Lichenihabitans sp. Uapishka_5]MDX7953951.1 aldo/keto reductase [Lichenihabitans sp. Uapishka_5]
MDMRALGRSGLKIAPLVFGGNVFGWTADEATSFALLDAFVDAGFNAIDTADVYSRWAPGHQGGESEAVIGRWLKANPGKRDKVLISTKVGMELGPDRQGLSARWIATAAEDSLRRLGIETIDLYQSHKADDAVPHAETLGAYAKLIGAGKVRAIGASNFSAAQLAAALEIAKAEGLPRYEALQPEYNLYDRASYDGPLRDLAIREILGVIPYFGLAAGFLTGKYRSEADLNQSPRGKGIAKYLNPRGTRILAALDAVSGDLGAKPAEVALAWLMAREGVTAPISSATSLTQLESLMKAARLRLPADAVAALDGASDQSAG